MFKITSKKKYLGINLNQGGNKSCLLKIIKCWLRKLKMIQRNGKISHALGLEELILLKWPYYPKQSTDLMQSLSKYPWQNTHRTRTNNSKIYMEPKKAQNCQSTSEEKEQSWRHNLTRLQTVLQNYSNQNSVILAQKQTYRPMEQNREPRYKPLCVWAPLTRVPRLHNEGRTVFPTNGTGKTGYPHAKDWRLSIILCHR